jgi:hypothetical protein
MRFEKGIFWGIERLPAEEERVDRRSSHEVRQSFVTILGWPDDQHLD